MNKVQALNPRKKKRTLVEAHMPPKDPANVLPMRGLAPWDDEKMTDYDYRNFTLYMTLLRAVEDGASVEQVAYGLLDLDPTTNPDWARRVTLSHFKRAQWVSDLLFPSYD